MEQETFAARVKRAEYAIRLWLATTFTGSLVKVSLGAGLGWVLIALPGADVPPIVAAMAAVAVPLTINALNSADGRYGLGRDEHDPGEPEPEDDDDL